MPDKPPEPNNDHNRGRLLHAGQLTWHDVFGTEEPTDDVKQLRVDEAIDVLIPNSGLHTHGVMDVYGIGPNTLIGDLTALQRSHLANTLNTTSKPDHKHTQTRPH